MWTWKNALLGETPPQTNTEFKNIFHTLSFGIFVAPRKEN